MYVEGIDFIFDGTMFLLRTAIYSVDILSLPLSVNVTSFSLHHCSHRTLPSCLFECLLMSLKVRVVCRFIRGDC